MPATPLPDFSRLLHDAQLVLVEWDRPLGKLSLAYKCLRQNVDGTKMDDTTVTLTLANVTALAVGYESSSLTMRPPQFALAKRIRAKDLTNWPFRTQEAGLVINPVTLEDTLDAVILDWMTGDAQAMRSAPMQWVVSFDQWLDFGMPIVYVRLLAGGDSYSIEGNGVPLDVKDWEAQYGAWWKAWKQHWADKSEEEESDEAGEFDAPIPAGESPAPDLSYQPPAESPFELEAHTVPAEVIEPIRTWFEAHQRKDWRAMAEAFPYAAVGLEERSAQLAKEYTDYAFGSWGYGRSIDSWWVEGRRACVVLRGIEHCMASEGDPASNRETVWEFALRQRKGRWIINSYSQGWPGFRSAKAKPAQQKPWLAKWKSGIVAEE
jgi:hypothetical protein